MAFRYSERVIIRKDAIKVDGTAAICLQVFINGKRKVLPLGIHCRPEEFVDEAVKLSDKLLSNKFNAIIKNAKAKALHVFSDSLLSGRPLTIAAFTEQFSNEDLSNNFYAFWKKEVAKMDGQVEAGTIRTYNTTMFHLQDYHRDALFSDLTYDFISGFDTFLKRKKLSTNTIWKHHKNIKKFINLAYKKGIRFPYPYDNFTAKKSKTDRVYLTYEEVNTLLQVYKREELVESLQKVLRYFLFLCMTGLRDSDARRLTVDNIGTSEITYQPQKTRSTRQLLRVELSEVAKDILYSVPFRMKCFPMPSTQKVNYHLKEIAHIYGIKKNISTSVGRHTFATNFLAAGGKVETLQQLMGHSHIATTMVYVHISPQRKREEMANFDKIFSF